jgi:pyruvate/2-oxoglutarate dehydrogenase complex dihydrolipoamide acyltransferase (E2) component
MAATVKLPKFGLTMEEATINEWTIGIGEHVEQGQTLATIDSEKVTMELPSPVSGVVAEYLVQVGETVAVGTPLAVIVAPDEFEQYASEEA